MILNQHIAQLHEFIDKMSEELRKDLNLAKTPGSTIGVSCDDSVKLNYVPSPTIVEAGLYVGITDPFFFVEVDQKEQNEGVVKFTVVGEMSPGPQYGFMDPDSFTRLFFKQNPYPEIVGLPLPKFENKKA